MIVKGNDKLCLEKDVSEIMCIFVAATFTIEKMCLWFLYGIMQLLLLLTVSFEI